MTTACIPQEMKFDLDAFARIRETGEKFVIAPERIAFISGLVNQVCDPKYERTPVFSSGGYRNMQYSAPPQNQQPQNMLVVRKKGHGRHGNVRHSGDGDWGAKFQPVVAKPPDEVDLLIENVRKCLNRVTEDTVAEMLSEIVENIDGMLLVLTDVVERDAFFMKVANAFFEIVQSNSTYSDSYVVVWNTLNERFHMTVAEANMIQNVIDMSSRFENVNADEDYDRYCVMNAGNRRRICMLKFFALLTNGCVDAPNKVITDVFERIVASLEGKFRDECNNAPSADVLTEVSNCYSALVSNGWDYIKSNDNLMDSTIEHIDFVISCNRKIQRGVSNKARFTHIDLKTVLGL